MLRRTICFGEFEIDSDMMRVTESGVPVQLEPRCYDLLLYLVENSTRVVSKDELFREVWKGVVVADGALARCVTKLRKALGESSRTAHYVRTVHGRGYQFSPEMVGKRHSPPDLMQDESASGEEFHLLGYLCLLQRRG